MKLTPTDENLARFLLETRTIAMVGASMNPERASHGVGQYLIGVGYRVIPVNPNCAGQMLFGEAVRPSIAAIDAPIDLLSVFRRSEFVLGHVKEAVSALPGLKAIWMQLGISSDPARMIVVEAGLQVVDNRCIRTEHRRLIGGKST
jgi:predicted CoA-binding protein